MGLGHGFEHLIVDVPGGLDRVTRIELSIDTGEADSANVLLLLLDAEPLLQLGELQL